MVASKKADDFITEECTKNDRKQKQSIDNGNTMICNGKKVVIYKVEKES